VKEQPEPEVRENYRRCDPVRNVKRLALKRGDSGRSHSEHEYGEVKRVRLKARHGEYVGEQEEKAYDDAAAKPELGNLRAPSVGKRHCGEPNGEREPRLGDCNHDGADRAEDDQGHERPCPSDVNAGDDIAGSGCGDIDPRVLDKPVLDGRLSAHSYRAVTAP
jgi:hypothetical protein